MENKYFFSKTNDAQFKHSIKLNDYYFNHNYEDAYINIIQTQNSYTIVIGDFIDAQSPLKTFNEIAQDVSKASEIFSLIEKTKYLTGRYIIFAGNQKGLRYVLTDPTVTIPINYMFIKNDFVISSHAKYIADSYNLKQSDVSTTIKEAAEQQQPLPYNITMFDEIKTLIPNHFLDIAGKRMERFYPLRPISTVSMDEVLGETIDKLKKILKGYFKERDISLPITSGVDSRAVLALMKEQKDKLKMFTYYHDEFTEETGDIKVPRKIAQTFNLDYQTFPIKKVPGDLNEEISDELAGLENYRILNNGYTYSRSPLAGHYPAQGDIVSLTKSPFGKNLPESWATLEYFVTKTHNYSRESKEYIQSWMEDTSHYSKENNVSMFDLYNWEYRLGRWLPNNIKNYDYFIDPIYIFNCRYLIELWVSISRAERTNRSFHLELIKKEWPELLEIPFNPDDKVLDNVFSNSYMFYFGSFIKYYLKKWL